MRYVVGTLGILSLFACSHSEETASHFNKEEALTREVSGTAYRGEDPVPNALIRVEPWERFEGPAALSTITDSAGRFTGLRTAPLRYDLTALLGDDVLTYRGAGGRVLNPTLEGSLAPPAVSWRTKLDIHLTTPPAPGHTVAFFANGDRVFGVTGSLAEGVSLVTNDYTAQATVFAVEYAGGDDFSTATAYGKAEHVYSNPSATVLAEITLKPIEKHPTVRFNVGGPMNSASADLYVTFSRTSILRVATLQPSVPLTIPLIPDAGTRAIVHGSADGATSTSGDIDYPFEGPPLAVELTKPPELIEPADGATVGTDVRLIATGTGVLEHMLTPEGGGRTIRIVTGSSNATLPTLDAAQAPKGRWVWTVRSFPQFTYPEQLTNIDVRRYQPSATSKPRTLTFQ